MSRSLIIAAQGIAFVILLLAVASAVLWTASRRVPEFYEQALTQQMPAEELAEAADQLEQEVLDLQSEIQTQETWEVIFTSEQINAWLAADLEQKFPQLLPTGVSEPRVAIEDGLAKVACRYTSPKFSTVFSLELDSFLTDTTNEFAIRIVKARAGALPVPLKRFFDQITARAEEANLSVLWTQQEDSPVALVKLPTNLDDVRSDVVIEVIEIEDGQIRIAGRVVPGVETQSMPQQPRFADASQPR
ncbi:MAG: hypothetical protein R3C28_29645 [Pirellulaceae bacterium]